MRRRFLLGAAVTLAGCGFELKRPPELPFRTIQLAGFAPRSQLVAELKQDIESGPTTRVVEAAKDAQVVLQSLGESREKVVVAQTAANQIREFELRLRFDFRLRTASGRELIPDSEILLKRSLTYTESAALAKEQEEAFLYRAMQSDIVAQVLRRLSSVRMP
ncbi:MAG: LPS assembly lipoprotein LptE [Caldimonas sp.]